MEMETRIWCPSETPHRGPSLSCAKSSCINWIVLRRSRDLAMTSRACFDPTKATRFITLQWNSNFHNHNDAETTAMPTEVMSASLSAFHDGTCHPFDSAPTNFYKDS